MEVVRDPVALRRSVADPERSVGFVPTMGALHEGHLSLVRMARADNDVVVVSIFVNPLQFGPNEDLDAYPRDEESDLALLEEEKVDIVFLPSVETLYPPGATTRVQVGPLGDVIEGALRPGHFEGVATVVAKLFHLVQPHRAYFGQKDAQQVAVLQKMVRDLDFPVALEVGPTVRAADGLALSSRNAYLSAAERAAAVALWRALAAGRDVLRAGGSPEESAKAMADLLAASEGVEPAYALAVDPATFAPADEVPVLLLVSATVGPARLIDNLLVFPNDPQGVTP